MITYGDIFQHLCDFIGQNPSSAATRDIRTAIYHAYNEITTAHQWSYLTRLGRILTSAPYSTGTIAYNDSTRTVTLTSGTFPTWAAKSWIRIANVLYRVDSNPTSTTLILDATLKPGANIAAGTAYVLVRSGYELPTDFYTMDSIIQESGIARMSFVHPRYWLDTVRAISDPGTPYHYTVVGSPWTKGRLALLMAPAPESSETYDFIYFARPRPLGVGEYSAGTITTTGSSTTVTGSGTAFTSLMAGCIFRAAATSAAIPTGFLGERPGVMEEVIGSVANATSLTLESAAPATYTGVKFTISDPIDLDETTMMNVFYRLCEYKLAAVRPMRDRMNPAKLYQDALVLAREADSRSIEDKGPLGRWHGSTIPLVGADIT